MTVLTKQERIELKKQQIGSRHGRKMKTYTEGFNIIFYFFLYSYRKDILTFPGEAVYTKYDKYGPDCKEGFRLYENGDKQYIEYNSLGEIIYLSRHSEILKGLIIAKKSWGLHVDMWSDGIVECSFTMDEVLQQFFDNNIQIPEPFLQDFVNRINKKKEIRNTKYLNQLKNEIKL